MTVVNFVKDEDGLSKKINFLEDFIPRIRNFDEETIVIYVDDVILCDENLLRKWASDVVLLKRFGANPIVVHGGEAIVKKHFEQYGIKFKKEDDVIVTDDSSIKILEMILKGKVASKIVTAINDAGGSAIGISGKDGNLIEAKKFRRSRPRSGNSNVQNIIDFGFNGKPTTICPEVLLMFEDSKSIPVISSIAIGENAETFYINPITVGAVIASSLVARMFIVMTEEGGVISSDGVVSDNIDYEDYEKSKSNYPISNIIKENIDFVFENHVEIVRVIDSKVPHSLLLNLFTDEKVGFIISNTEYN